MLNIGLAPGLRVRFIAIKRNKVKNYFNSYNSIKKLCERQSKWTAIYAHECVSCTSPAPDPGPP